MGANRYSRVRTKKGLVCCPSASPLLIVQSRFMNPCTTVAIASSVWRIPRTAIGQSNGIYSAKYVSWDHKQIEMELELKYRCTNRKKRKTWKLLNTIFKMALCRFESLDAELYVNAETTNSTRMPANVVKNKRAPFSDSEGQISHSCEVVGIRPGSHSL